MFNFFKRKPNKMAQQSFKNIFERTFPFNNKEKFAELMKRNVYVNGYIIGLIGIFVQASNESKNEEVRNQTTTNILMDYADISDVKLIVKEMTKNINDIDHKKGVSDASRVIKILFFGVNDGDQSDENIKQCMHNLKSNLDIPKEHHNIFLAQNLHLIYIAPYIMGMID